MLMYFFLLLNTQHLIIFGSSESQIPEDSMTESFVFQDIEYLLCGYRVTWDEAHIICLSYKAQLATLDSESKSNFVVQAIAESSFGRSVLGFDDFWIGGRSDLAGSWYWVSSQQRLATEKSLYENYPPWYPTSPPRKIQCLTIDRRNHDLPIFVPLSCSQFRPFVCQKDNNAMFARKITTISTTRVADEEFTVFSARVTWAEAVVKCRKEKLQIAEVKSVEEAHALALTMLRARPEGIENAWIGGYLKDATWTWLPSANEINQDTGLWRNGSRSSHGCLMLDRHTSQTPVYLEAKCDRKRHVVCQKPSRRSLDKAPVPVSIEGCKYWLGFYPVQWHAARRSCSELNATLVILDSERTVKRMMKLMLENRHELKHVWTDGRRRSSLRRNSYEILEDEWLWESTQEPIPRAGENFIPWCDADKYSNGTECLNLDREDYDSPIVYGLDCDQNQTYVCQPLSGPCVSHEIGSPSIDDNISSAVLSLTRETTYWSKISETPIATLRENTVNANTFHITLTSPSSTPYRNVQGFATLPSSGVWQQVNESSQNNSKVNIEHISQNYVGAIFKAGLTDFLRPYFQLSFPTLPQFGIKLASAQNADTLSILEEKTHESTDKITKAPFDISPSGQPSTTAKSTTISLLSTAPPDADFEISRTLLDFVTPSSADHTSTTEGDSKRRRTDQDSEIHTKFANSSFNIRAFESTTPAQEKLMTNADNGEVELPLSEQNVSKESEETYLPYLSTVPMNHESTTLSSVPAVVEINTSLNSIPIISTGRTQNVTSGKHSNGDTVLSDKSEFQQETSSSKSVEQRMQSNGYNSTKVPAGPTTPMKLSSMNSLRNWTTDTLKAISQPIDYQYQTFLRSSPTTSRSTSRSSSSTATNSWDIKTKAYSIDGTIDWKSDTEVIFQKKITKSTGNPLEATKKIALEHDNIEDGVTEDDNIEWAGNGYPGKKKKGNKLTNPFEIHDDAMNSQREEEEEDENYLYNDGPEPIGTFAVTKSYIGITGGIRNNFEDVTEFMHEKDTESETYKGEEKTLFIKKLLLHAKSSDDKFKNANNRRFEETTVSQSRRLNVEAFSLRPYYVLERPLSLNFSSNGGSDETRILPVYGARCETATSTLDKETISGEGGRTDHYTFSRNSESKSTNLDISNIWDLVKGVKIDFNPNALSKFLQHHNIGQSNKNGKNSVSHNEFPLFPNALNGMDGFKIDFNGNPIRVRIKTSRPDDPPALSESTKLTGADTSMKIDNTRPSNFLQLFLRIDKNPKNFQKLSNLFSNFSKNMSLANDSLTRTADLYLNIHSYPPLSSDAYTRPITEPESTQLKSSKNKSPLEKLINPRNESDDFYYSVFENMTNSSQHIRLNRRKYLLYLVLRQLINMTEADLKLYNSETLTSNGSLARDSLLDLQKRLQQVIGQWKNPKSILSQRSLMDGTDSSNQNVNENSASPINENKIPTLFIRANLGLDKNSTNKKP